MTQQINQVPSPHSPRSLSNTHYDLPPTLTTIFPQHSQCSFSNTHYDFPPPTLNTIFYLQHTAQFSIYSTHSDLPPTHTTIFLQHSQHYSSSTQNTFPPTYTTITTISNTHHNTFLDFCSALLSS
jgi:hypothetical protein